jgi:serine/threonine-protein kinase
VGLSTARAGPYELLQQLSAGGSGEVYVARRADEAGEHQRVAVKWLLPYLASEPDVVTRFLDEVRIVARMRHPNIVPIFDVGMSEGRPWLAMELVEGVSLHTLLGRCRARGEMLPLPVVRLIAASLLDALAYAHTLAGPQVLPREQSGPLAGRPRLFKPESLQVIHRDVSPSNVLISMRGAVVLTDFGLARATINWAKTSPGGLGGIKIGYTAPEVVDLGGASVDQRADIFGAGVTLFEALTLQHPFRRLGFSDVQTISAVARDDALIPSAERQGVSARVDNALLKAIRHAADGRFDSAAELKAAFVDGQLAPARELGAIVCRLCPDELARFLWLDDAITDSTEIPTATTEVTDPGKTVIVLPAQLPSRRTVALAGGAAVLVAIAGTGLVRWLRRPPPTKPTPPPEAEAVLTPVDAGAVPEPVPDEVELKPTEEHVGWLIVESDTPVPVLLDGDPLGTTPLERVSVAPGRHVVTLKLKRGEVRRKVMVVEGKDVTVRSGR